MPHRLIARVAAVSAAIILVACAGSVATPAVRETACALRGQDSSFAMGQAVYRDCGVDVRARLVTTRVRPDFTPTRTTSSSCYSADFEFVVDTLGNPELVTLRLAQSNDQAFAAAAKAVVPSLHYEPAKKGGSAVRQIVAYSPRQAIVVSVSRSGTPSGPSTSGMKPRC